MINCISVFWHCCDTNRPTLDSWELLPYLGYLHQDILKFVLIYSVTFLFLKKLDYSHPFERTDPIAKEFSVISVIYLLRSLLFVN